MLLVGDRQEEHLACKMLGVGDDLTGTYVRLIAPVVTTTSIILSPNKIQNGDIRLAGYLGYAGKWTLNESCCM